MNKLLLVLAILFTTIIAVIGSVAPSVKADTITNNTPLTVGLGLPLTQYELRVQGERHPIKVIEFLDKRGHHCVTIILEHEIGFECEGH
jgi:hypothetical protein